MRGAAGGGDCRRRLGNPGATANAAFQPATFPQGIISSHYGGAADGKCLGQGPFRRQPDTGMNSALPDGVHEPASQLLLKWTGTGGPDSEVRYQFLNIHISPILMQVALFFKSTLSKTERHGK
jgi:hypothetical protein